MGRTLKAELSAALAGDAEPGALAATLDRKAASPLIGFLCAGDERVRWRAIRALGLLAARLYGQEPEQARVILRRLWWMLNDESGGIGWGAPEAMAEVLAVQGGRLADEFGKLLVSLINPEGNYLELPALRRGAVWGVGRLCRVRPDLCAGAGPHLVAGLGSKDACLRGLSAWALAGLPALPTGARESLARLSTDGEEVRFFDGEKMALSTVSRLAAMAGRAMQE